jgi:hypothetical protein
VQAAAPCKWQKEIRAEAGLKVIDLRREEWRRKVRGQTLVQMFLKKVRGSGFECEKVYKLRVAPEQTAELT